MKEILPFARAVCYSGYRKNQSPINRVYPSKIQIKEDLDILVKAGFSYIRMYDAISYAEDVCQVIRENKLPLKLMLGSGLINEINNVNCAWNKTVYSDEELAIRKEYNRERIANLCKIGCENKDVICCVSVGNENTPDWGENTVSVDALIEYAEILREYTGLPVTFNEGAREWKRLQRLADHLDIISIHSYPLWYGNSEAEAIASNKEDYNAIKELYSDKQVIFTEAGWTTSSLDNQGMKPGEATEENQLKYMKEFWDWTDGEKILSFVFEAFDEPWKGGNNSQEAEKHWGLYYEDRLPKPVAKELLNK